MLAMIDRAVVGYAPFFPVRLLVFPEFGHAAPIYPTWTSCSTALRCQSPTIIPTATSKKRNNTASIFRPPAFLEKDDRYPGQVFNTTCLIGPDGLLTRYRKVHPWIPWEVHASPHELARILEEMWRWRRRRLGGSALRLVMTGYSRGIRQLALAGAEVLVRVSAYMDPWERLRPWTGGRGEPLPGLGKSGLCGGGQPRSARDRYPPFSWPGGSMIVDYDGRILAQADPGQERKFVVGPIDLAALRAEREQRRGPSHARPPPHGGLPRLPANDLSRQSGQGRRQAFD